MIVYSRDFEHDSCIESFDLFSNVIRNLAGKIARAILCMLPVYFSSWAIPSRRKRMKNMKKSTGVNVKNVWRN